MTALFVAILAFVALVILIRAGNTARPSPRFITAVALIALCVTAGFVGVAGALPVILGGTFSMPRQTFSSRPACDVDRLGAIWLTPTASGSSDIPEMCSKSVPNTTPAWHALTISTANAAS